MSLEEIKQAKNKVAGMKETMRAIENGQAEIVYLAEDADQKVKDPLQKKCEEEQVEIEYVSSMQALGSAAGIEVKAATACILKD